MSPSQESLPELPTPVLQRIDAGEVEIACFEWGETYKSLDQPSILLLHATGFHARCWDQVVRRLGSRHVLAVDLRGHGRSSKIAITEWQKLGEDIARVADHFELQGAIGVGHSMGGHTLVETAALRPESFSRLVLVDPVIFAPEAYNAEPNRPRNLAEHPIAKRKNSFASADEMYERFRDRSPYSLFRPEVLRDYCDFGLLPVPPEPNEPAPNDSPPGFELACPPYVEASVYGTSFSNRNVYRSVEAIEIPVRILRAPNTARDGRLDFSSSPTWPQLATKFKDARDTCLNHLTHFIPMQEPETVARHILDPSF